MFPLVDVVIWWVQAIGAFLAYVVVPLGLVALRNWKHVNKLQNGELEKRFSKERHDMRNEFINIIKDLTDRRNAEMSRIEDRLVYIERHIMSGGQHH